MSGRRQAAQGRGSHDGVTPSPSAPSDAGGYLSVPRPPPPLTLSPGRHGHVVPLGPTPQQHCPATSSDTEEPPLRGGRTTGG